MTNREFSPFNIVTENSLAKPKASTTPRTYNERTTIALYSTKKTPTNNTYTGSRAEHDITSSTKRSAIFPLMFQSS